MNHNEIVSLNDGLNDNNRPTDQLADFLMQYGYEEPLLLQKENELNQQMVNSIQLLSQALENLYIPYTKEPGPKWITTRMVLIKYGISLRTQANWRESGKLNFTQVELKIYYNEQDLENLFLKGYKKGKNKECTI